MNSLSSPTRHAARVAAALLPAALLLAPAAADAQCITPPAGELDPNCVDAVGLPVCFVRPNAVPGLSGMPVWPASTAAPPAGSTTRPEVSEPRWSSSPLHGFFSGVANSRPDQAAYRIVMDSATNQAAVSIQLRSATNSPVTDDYVYFGLADAAGNNARGIRISLAAAALGAHVPVPAADIIGYQYASPNWSAGSTSWISAASMWKFTTGSDADRQLTGLNGAMVAVEFKVDLNAFSFAAGAQPRITLGVDADFASDGTTAIGRQQFFLPNVTRCNGTCTVQATPPGLEANPFILPRLWSRVAPLGSTCDGISIARQDISTTRRCGTNNERTNCVTGLVGQSNTFEARPDVPPEWSTGPGAKLVNAGELRVQFKMSNWGSVGDPAQWIPMIQAANTQNSNDLEMFPVTATCPANTTAGNICSVPITNTGSPTFHQCLLAELSTPAATVNKITFANSAAYINTRFATASTIDVPAQLNLKGIPQPAAGTTRDVYLHLVSSNMRVVGTTTTTLNVPALEALRTQADPGFDNTAVGCDQGPRDRCFPNPSGGGICRTPAFVGDGIFCQVGQPINYGAEGFWCQTAQTETCTLPAGGSLDRDVSAQTASQRLTGSYPTVEVFPFYDSGATVTIKGRARKKLVAMPSFGIHATHTGPFYGWSRTLLDSAGNPLPEVFPNVFRITVGSSGLADIRVRMTAEEAQPAMFFQIAGNATPAGFGLGQATINGLTRTRTFNLSQSTVVIRKLLSNNGTSELVSGVGAGITLTRLPGALPNLASFAKLGSPTITMQLVNLPLLGQTAAIQVNTASIAAPPSCFLGFGVANITTSFTVNDGAGSTVLAEGSDYWTCVPFQMLNF